MEKEKQNIISCNTVVKDYLTTAIDGKKYNITKITKTKNIITLNKEYRTALISEVVSGKIRVTQEVV